MNAKRTSIENQGASSLIPDSSGVGTVPAVRRTIIALVVLVLAGCGSSKKESSSSTTQPTSKHRSGFSASVTNPWFPLRRGSVYHYRGVKDGEPSRDVVVVTDRTTTIDGAPCVAVSDRLYLSGRLEERTTDWYTQDAKGNVWYFGENTAELDANGKVKTTSGSWKAGVDGAKPGLFMFAHPTVGQGGRQEYLKGEAEDRYQVVSLAKSVSVPLGSYRHVMLTKEWTPLEPDVLDHKYYVRGIGTVLENTVKGGVERNELVSFRRGA